MTTRDFRGAYTSPEYCQKHEPEIGEDICTKDKILFMKYAGYYWGFLSSFICNTEKFRLIANPEQYVGTYWLQSYIHALCAAGSNTELGVIKGPCVGAGVYVNTANFDSALINGIYYKKMLDFMVSEAGFNDKQLERLYKSRFFHLLRHDILKEKAMGIHKLNKNNLFECTQNYPMAWITVYPLLLVPELLCKVGMRLYRKKLKISDNIRINRPE